VEGRSFRQWGQLMVGAVLAAVAAGIAWAMVGGWMSRSPAGVAWCAVLLILSYVVFLRPCVVVDDRGVQVRNIVRDARVPWAQVRGAGSSWNLVIDTDAGPRSSWAISGTASPGRDALLRRRRGGAGGRQDAGGAAGPGGVGGPVGVGGSDEGTLGYVATVDADAVSAGLTPPPVGASAAAIAALVRRRAQQAGTPSPTSPEQLEADSRMVWSSVALLGLAALAVPLAVLL